MTYQNNILFDLVKSEIGTRELSNDCLKTLTELLKKFILSVSVKDIVQDKDFVQKNINDFIFYQAGKQVDKTALDFSKEIVLLQHNPSYCGLCDANVHILYLYFPD